jgi:hypothetical protein
MDDSSGTRDGGLTRLCTYTGVFSLGQVLHSCRNSEATVFFKLLWDRSKALLNNWTAKLEAKAKAGQSSPSSWWSRADHPRGKAVHIHLCSQCLSLLDTHVCTLNTGSAALWSVLVTSFPSAQTKAKKIQRVSPGAPASNSSSPAHPPQREGCPVPPGHWVVGRTPTPFLLNVSYNVSKCTEAQVTLFINVWVGRLSQFNAISIKLLLAEVALIQKTFNQMSQCHSPSNSS